MLWHQHNWRTFRDSFGYGLPYRFCTCGTVEVQRFYKGLAHWARISNVCPNCHGTTRVNFLIGGEARCPICVRGLVDWKNVLSNSNV